MTRYNKYYTNGDVTFFLQDVNLDIEECHFLMMKVIEQAISDYCNLAGIDLTYERNQFETAKKFLFDKTYKIPWGDWRLSLEEFLDILDLDIEWFRTQILIKFVKTRLRKCLKQEMRKIYGKKS